VSAARERAICAADLASHIEVRNEKPAKKAASLANQERRNSRGGVGHAKAGNKISAQETSESENRPDRK
jgi:hypothetical protein